MSVIAKSKQINLTENLYQREKWIIKLEQMAKKYNAKIIGIFMNTSISLMEQRRLRRNDPFPKVAINKQLKQLQTPTLDEGFDKLLVKKNYESPKIPKIQFLQVFLK